MYLCKNVTEYTWFITLTDVKVSLDKITQQIQNGVEAVMQFTEEDANKRFHAHRFQYCE
jgi:hypothetical protein